MLQPGEPFPCSECNGQLFWRDLDHDRCPHCGAHFLQAKEAFSARARYLEKTMPPTSDRGEKAISILKYLLAYGGWYMGAIEGDRMRQDFEMLHEKAMSLLTHQEREEVEKYYDDTAPWEEVEKQVRDI